MSKSPPATSTEVLAELRRQLLAAEETSPELRRPLRQARASIERALGLRCPSTTEERNRRRGEGLR